ncbi:MAG: hypothetical protein Q4G62_01665 [Pseudomonadota bacterium]|nr:hypothetical protein [Pseudomonadota bacterium]
MIMLIGWLAAVVAFVTALSMIGDTYINKHDRRDIRAVLSCAARHLRAGQPVPVEIRRELRSLLSYSLRSATLIVIVASSFVVVLVPVTPAQLTASNYEVLMRVALAAFLALQSPCPWWRYVSGIRKRGSTPQPRAPE